MYDLVWNLAWFVPILGWLAWEAWALWDQTDGRLPFTYWWRSVFNLKRGPFAVGWWFTLALIGWLGWHLLVEGVFL